MADDGIGLDADRTPHRPERDHLHEQRRLHDRGAVADITCAQQIAKRRFAEQFAEKVVAAVDFGPEGGNRVVEQRTHTRPLSTLTRQDVREPVRRRGIVATHHGGVLAAVDHRPQGGLEAVTVGHHRQRAVPSRDTGPKQHVRNAFR